MILDGRISENIAQAAELLRAGNVVGMPTETVYGLAARFDDESAVRKIFEIKKRDLKDPLIVHLASMDQLHDVAIVKHAEITRTLAEKFWPGPLTLVLPKREHISKVITAGLETVAVRVPAHPVAQALIQAAGPLVAPSANRHKHLSPTSARDVEEELGDQVPLILDGGPCEIGVESTIISLVQEPRILRPGGISKEALLGALGKEIEIATVGEKIIAPGMMDLHYAPTKPLVLFSKEELQNELKAKKLDPRVLALVCFSDKERGTFGGFDFQSICVLSPGGNLEEAARNLFGVLRTLDRSSVKIIVVLSVPEQGVGAAINDRLSKAQHL